MKNIFTKKQEREERSTNSNILQSRLSSNRQVIHDMKKNDADALKPNYTKQLFNSQEVSQEVQEETINIPQESNPLSRLNRNIKKQQDLQVSQAKDEYQMESENIAVKEDDDDGLDMKEVSKIVKIVKETLKDNNTDKKAPEPQLVRVQQAPSEPAKEVIPKQFIPEPVSKQKTMLEHIISVFIVIITAMIVFIICKYFLCDVMITDGDSMKPTYEDGQMIFVNKIKYQITSPAYGDIVLIKKDSSSDSDYIIKRIIACPGDRVYISNGTVYVNGVESQYKFDNIIDAGIAAEEIKLNDDEYFVLGDNRNQSTDSRSKSIGVIEKDEIKGQAKSELPAFLNFMSVFAKKVK